MRRELRAPLAHERGHFDELGDAAHLGHGGLGILNSIEQRGELRYKAAVLAGGDRNAAALADRAQARAVFRRKHRLLEPIQAKGREALADRDGLRYGPLAVHVEE